MKADFLDSHNRHWLDGEKLFRCGRWANADHLYGIAAECGLKALMKLFGMGIDISTGAPSAKDDKVHIPKIWNRFDSYRSGIQAISYSLPENPFRDWDISQRYTNESYFQESNVGPHREGSLVIRKLTEKAIMEGLM